jgi:hypothetical protein
MSPAGLGTKNDCDGESQQQFTHARYVVQSKSHGLSNLDDPLISQTITAAGEESWWQCMHMCVCECVCSLWSTPSWSEVTIRPLLSSKRKSHFKTCKVMDKTKMRSWVINRDWLCWKKGSSNLPDQPTQAVHWLMLVLSNRPNRTGISHLLTWERTQIQLLKHCVV